MAKDLHDSFVNRKITKPNPFLAWVVGSVFKNLAKKQNVEYVYTDEFLKTYKEQTVYLCQHRSKNDFIYMLGGLKNRKAHVVIGYQNVFQKGVYFLLKKLGAISKKLYQPDSVAVKQILQAVRLGNSVVIFPEGIQSTSGSTHPINPATVKLLTKLKLPVTLVTIKGSYFARPRFSSETKKGKITVSFSRLFSKEDLTNESNEQLYQRLLKEFSYNEFTEHANEKIAFHGKKPNIDGLNNIIYKCPHCQEERCFEINNANMQCVKCGFTCTMDEYYNLKAVNKDLPFANVDEWYKWQRKIISEQVKSDDFKLTARVKLGKINTKKLGPNYSLVYEGEGVLTLTNKGLTYKGTRKGEKVELFFEAQGVYSLSMSLQYDFDIYYKNEYYNFKLLENHLEMAKWTLASEEIHNLYDENWKKASEDVYDYSH